MSPISERYSDVVGDDRDTDLQRVIVSLDMMRRASTTSRAPVACDQIILASLHERAGEGQIAVVKPRVRSGLRVLRQSKGPRRVAIYCVTIVAVAAGSIGTYLRVHTPTPVSAAEVLRHAALRAEQATAGQVVHETSIAHVVKSTVQGPAQPNSVTYDRWSQAAPNGGVARETLRYRDGARSGGFVADAHGNLWTFDSGSNVVSKSTWIPGQTPFETKSPDARFLAKSTVEGPQDPGGIRELVALAERGTDAQTVLLPQQTIDGAPADVVRITQSLPDVTTGGAPTATPSIPTRVVITVYIDASSYLIRSIDQRSTGGTGATLEEQTLKIVRYDVVPDSQAPAGVFSFTPEPGSRVITITPPAGNMP